MVFKWNISIEVDNYDFLGEGGSVESLLFSSEDIKFMNEAKEMKIRRSVQAGEFGPPDMVFQALEKLQADRIVFGYSVPQVKLNWIIGFFITYNRLTI